MKMQQGVIEQRALWLGYMGLLPLIAGAVSLAFFRSEPEIVLNGVHGYGAVILTFVGAIHWGRSLNSEDVDLMTWSVVPSLLAWVSLFLTPEFGLPVLVISFLSLYQFDHGQYANLIWFRRLRFRLTASVTVLLLISWLLSLMEV
jgi:hypothetical protein